MMNVETITQTSSATISPVLESRLLNHRAHLGSKYAFLFNQEVINRVKNGTFTKPPRRDIAEELERKIEQEASTSAGSNDSVECSPILGPRVNAAFMEAFDEQPQQVERTLQTLTAYEDYLVRSPLITPEAVPKARALHRQSLATLQEAKALTSQSSETALAVMVFSAERLGIDIDCPIKFSETMPVLKKINKLARIRSNKVYKQLSGSKIETIANML